MALNLSTTEGIRLQRVSGTDAGFCDACKFSEAELEMALVTEEQYLVLDLPRTYMSFCPFHEGELLQRLLGNYLKRLRKKQNIGFTGELAKGEEKANEGSV